VAAKLKDHGFNLTNGSQSVLLCHQQAMLISSARVQLCAPLSCFVPESAASSSLDSLKIAKGSY
jgi:hypothetical protein